MTFEHFNDGSQSSEPSNNEAQEKQPKYLGEALDGRPLFLCPDGSTATVGPAGEYATLIPGSAEDAASYEMITGKNVKWPVCVGLSLDGVSGIYLHADGRTVAVNLLTGESMSVLPPDEEGTQSYGIITGGQQASSLDPEN